MKYLMTALILFSAVANAKNCTTTNREEEIKETMVITSDVPNHLKGAKIIVRLADGRETEVPAEKFKVVPRKQERLVSKVEKTITEVCKEGVNKPNRVSLLAGNGVREGLDKSVSTTRGTVENDVGFVGGLQYQRSLNESISVGVQGQTNKTGSLMIGLDF